MKHEVPEGVTVKFAHGRRVEGDWGLWHRKKENWGRWHPEATTDGLRTHTSGEISSTVENDLFADVPGRRDDLGRCPRMF